MQLLVTEKHEGCGEFPLFKKGSVVGKLTADSNFSTSAEAIWGSNSSPHWFACMIDRYETFVPDIYVSDGVLLQDYNPTELKAEKGQKVTLKKIVYEWFFVEDENGCMGWLPANKVTSV